MGKPFVKIFNGSSLVRVKELIDGYIEENKINEITSANTFVDNSNGYTEYIVTVIGVLNNE